MGGREGPGSCVMISQDLCNTSHVDHKDESMSFGVWTEEIPGKAKEWFFVLPNVSIQGSSGVAIRLYSGCAIEWDGRKLQHCTMLGSLGRGNHVYGCMVGSCRPSGAS